LKIDASVKRNTTFIKKLKTLSEENKEAIIQELNLINLSRYISEVVTSIAEAPIKIAQVEYYLIY